MMYRVYGGEKAAQIGPWWSRTPPKGALQAQIDLALPPNNPAQNFVTITVPKGTVVYEGGVAPNFGKLGGGTQVYIQKVDPAWVYNHE